MVFESISIATNCQAAMRHSDIKLTMGTYTDPKLLDVREAIEKLRPITLNTNARDPMGESLVGTTGCTSYGQHGALWACC